MEASKTPTDNAMVSCLMPVGRRTLVLESIQWFWQQRYEPKELLILDCGDDPVGDLVPDDRRVRYFRLPHNVPESEQLLFGTAQANGDLIAHWPVGLWCPPHRLDTQAKSFLAGNAEVCAVSSVFVVDCAARRSYRIGSSRQVPAAYCSSMMYRRSWLADSRVPLRLDSMLAVEPSEFCSVDEGLVCVLLSTAPDCLLIGENRAQADRARAANIRRILGADWEIARTLLAPQAMFLERYSHAYQRILSLAQTDRSQRAVRFLESLEVLAPSRSHLALIWNDLAALAALRGDIAAAQPALENALSADRNCAAALLNRNRIQLDAQALSGPHFRGVAAR